MLSHVRRRKIALPESGVEIALLDWGGDGPLALLHHANGFCAGVWGLVAEPLSRHFRVIAMDARGHGDSSKPEGADSYRWEKFGEDVAGVAEQLAAEHPDGKIALGLGHSFGGTSILMAGVARPDLFGRAVLVDPVVPPPDWASADPERALRGNSLAEGARKRRMVWPSREAARQKWVEKQMFAAWDPRALALYLEEGMVDRADGQVELKCPGEIEATVFESSRGLDVYSIAERSSVPTRILWAKGGDFPRIAHEQLALRMSDADVRDLDAGHLAVMEQPELVCEAVLGFAL
jgi:pimeloyl-ACP methyl ester carboxylesterase